MADGITVLRLDSNQESLVVISFEAFEASELYFSKAREVLPEDLQTDDTNEDLQVSNALQESGGVWVDVCFMILSCRTNSGSVLRAVGAGSNVKKRKQAGRLALATAVLLFGKTPVVAPELATVVAQAQRISQQVQQQALERQKRRLRQPQPPMLSRPTSSTINWLTPDVGVDARPGR